MTRKYMDIVIGGLVALFVIIAFMFSVSVRHTVTPQNVPVCEADPLAHPQECLQP